VFKTFFDDELIKPIVLETNTYAAQKLQTRSFIPFRSRIRDWKPVTTDEMYVVLALFMLMGIIKKPTLRSYISKNCIMAPSSLALLCLWIGLNQSAISCILTTIMWEQTRHHQNYSKSTVIHVLICNKSSADTASRHCGPIALMLTQHYIIVTNQNAVAMELIALLTQTL
jgi:hypothetical protein